MDQKTIDAYNHLAGKYDEETSDFWKKFPRTFLDEFIKLVDDTVLDVGSGPGRDAVILRDHGLHVTCIDASRAMIEMSRAKGLASVLGNFESLPFDDGSFGGVWAYTSLLHVPKNEIEKPLREIRRVLKPDGVFGLGLIEGTMEEYRQTEKVPEDRWFSFYTREEVENLLAQYGFEIVYFEQFKPKTKNYLNFISKKIGCS